MKRLFDCFISAIGLVLFSPLFVAIGLMVLLSMGSPIFFRQVRPGRGGKVFTLLKFRTMRENPAGGDVLPDGERLTRLGKILAAHESR